MPSYIPHYNDYMTSPVIAQLTMRQTFISTCSPSELRVYKKVSTNGKLVLYLLNRDLIITKDTITPLHAVITADAEEVRNKKVNVGPV